MAFHLISSRRKSGPAPGGSGGGGGSDSFTADPYNAYATRLVDPAISSDVAGGTTATRTWNGVSSSYQCYKTIQYAITDYLTQGGRRIGLLQSTTYTLAADLTFPASGTDDNTRCILQGDPAATSSALPIINLNTIYGIKPDKNGNRNYLTIRKIEITGQNKISTDGNSNPSAVYWGVGGTYTGAVVEFCYVHDCFADSGAYDYGGVTFGPSESTSSIVRYCRFKNIGLASESPNFHNNNFCGVYVGATRGAVVHSSYFENTSSAGYHKVPYPGGDVNSPNGSIWHHNYIKGQHNNGIQFALAGISGQYGYFGCKVYNNLFESIDQNAIYPEQINNGPQCDDFLFWNNTIVTADNGLGVAGFNGIDARNNAIIVNTWNIYTEDGGSYTTRFAACDYNAYGSAQWSMRSDGSRTDYANLAAWKAATSGQSAELTTTGSPDAHALSITTSVFRDSANHDYSPANGSALLNAGSDGKNIGCYDGATIAASTLVGAGWT